MMAAKIEICGVCDKSMIDPRLLPCAHSFCFHCLETSSMSKELLKCQTCQLNFKIPRGGLKDLRKNEFIERLHEIRHGSNNDVCIESQTIRICNDRSSNLCSNQNKQFEGTKINELMAVTIKQETVENIKKEYKICNNHQEAKTLFCCDCNRILCGMCMTMTHKRHTIIHISQYLDEMKETLNDIIKEKQLYLENVAFNLESSENNKIENERRANELKKEIEKRGEELKKNIDLFVVELKNNVDENLKEFHKKADDAMMELQNLDICINEKLTTLKRQLKDLNDKQFVEMSTLKENFENIQKYEDCFEDCFEDYFELTLSCDKINNDIKSIFGRIIDNSIERTFQYSFNINDMTELIITSEFYVRQLPWCIYIYPFNGTDDDDSNKYLGIFLRCNGNPHSDWSCKAHHKLKLISDKSNQCIREYDNIFEKKHPLFGYDKYITMKDLLNPNNGYVKDGSVTIEVYLKADVS